MARGVTNQPLKIGVARKFFSHPAILELMRQGHTVVALPDDEFDLLLAEEAHFFNETMADYLPAALTAARKRKNAAKTAANAAKKERVKA